MSRRKPHERRLSRDGNNPVESDTLADARMTAAHGRGRLGGGCRVEPLERRVLFAAGDLDPTFGGGGTVVTRIPSYAHAAATAVVPLPDGKTWSPRTPATAPTITVA
jgi:hypothetical protein